MPLKAGHFYYFGPYRLDAEQRLLWNGDDLVPLTLKALETLLALVESPGQLVEKDELMKRLWPDSFVEENNLAFNISVLRKTLTDGQSGFAYIETIPRRGYRFIAPVTETGPASPNSGPGERAAGPAAIEIEPVVSRANGAPSETTAESALGPEAGGADEVHSVERPPDANLRTAALQQERPLGILKERRMPWPIMAAATAAVAVLALYALSRPLPLPVASSPQQLTNDGFLKGYLATDGVRLYFTERAPTGERLLKEMSVDGREARTITAPPGDGTYLDMCPNRSSLLFSGTTDEAGPMWFLPLPAGSAQRVGDLLGNDATCSPDGRRIAYVSGGKLWVANRDGGEARVIAALKGYALYPHWSPDGSRLRFVFATLSGLDPVQESLWEVAPDGTGLRKLPPAWNALPEEAGGLWTPDGRYFLFWGGNTESKSDLWTVREQRRWFQPGAGQPVRLGDLYLSCLHQVLSPDGKRVFFLGHLERGHLQHFSSVEKQFVDFLDGLSAEFVTYSPDGAQVAYVKYGEGTLWVMKSNGKEPRQLTYLPTKVQGLAWSPDGTEIAISARTPTSSYKNYLVAAKGGEPVELIPGYNQLEGIPSWSKDGTKIAFGDVPETFGRGSATDVIRVLNLTTGKIDIVPHSQGFWSPRWSPDGRYIAAVKNDDPDPYHQALFLFDGDTATWRDLHADHIVNFVWSHDGRFIYYDGESGHEGIFKLRVPDGRPELVADTKNVLRADSAVWFGLTPDDSPLILGDVAPEIYSMEVHWP